jgi:cyclopropane fatty-acyl-phospholipid synthase-like methyltransferase
VIELGCGTGSAAWWLSQQGYRVLGIDTSPHMLAQAEQQSQRWGEATYDPPEFVQLDMRQFESPLGKVDLVVAVGGVLNAVQSLRELEATFNRVQQALEVGRLFIFDIRTIRGLAVNSCDTIAYDNGDDLEVIVRSRFNYETLSNSRQYTLWRRQENLWQRQDEIHIERGFPAQGINMLLERAGFRVAALLNSDFEVVEAQQDLYEQVIFIAEKQPSGGA